MKTDTMLSTYVVSDSSTQAIGPRTLENLSPEILMIIFEQVSETVMSLPSQDPYFTE